MSPERLNPAYIGSQQMKECPSGLLQFGTFKYFVTPNLMCTLIEMNPVSGEAGKLSAVSTHETDWVG